MVAIQFYTAPVALAFLLVLGVPASGTRASPKRSGPQALLSHFRTDRNFSSIPVANTFDVPISRHEGILATVGAGLRRVLFSGMDEEHDQHMPATLPMLIIPVLLGFALMGLVLVSFADFGEQKKNYTGRLRPWSITGVVALTSYRFYTGFLSATWMPYLLAMEGHGLMAERQSFFMGTAKLIYGMSILFNPVYGLAGDQMATVSHWTGRRIFILAGVALGGLGIYGCLAASHVDSVPWYFIGVILWMTGEAMADVTTETLVPELLPREQYEMSSSIRALNFLLGGLAGYVLLIVFRHYEYSWLYFAYLILMCLCAFLTLAAISTGTEEVAPRPLPPANERMSFARLLAQAYVVPTQHQGGFPRACLALFSFSLGSAPMFFLFLMVRDIVGIQDSPSRQQMHFSVISIVFFVAAGVASTFFGTSASRGPSADAAGARGVEEQQQGGGEAAAGPEAGAGAGALLSGAASSSSSAEGQGKSKRFRTMKLAIVAYTLVTVFMPIVGLMPTESLRLAAFYAMAVLFGFAFGSVYARFQECTWSILPPGVDVANAMGFAAMCKLLGVGLGNFFAGLILDYSTAGPESIHYSGYVVMCVFCGAVAFFSGYLVHSCPYFSDN